MQFSKIASLFALVAAVSARKCSPDEVNCDGTEPAKSWWGTARIHNRCPYTVYMWSIVTAMGCNPNDAIVLKPGESYSEGFREPVGGQGCSIKISKEKKCKGVDINQLEYYMDETAGYNSTYLDVSYVDCQGKECPACSDGFYLHSGNTGAGLYTANDVNEICPILSCSNAAECATMAYVNPDDRQTKSCNQAADLDFYMCGGEAPGSEPAPSSSEVESSAPAATSTKSEKPIYSAEEAQVNAAAVTPAPESSSEKPYHVKTEVVYVTEIAYVNAKRHAHNHRHQHFRA